MSNSMTKEEKTMKKSYILAAASAVMMLFASCQKTPVANSNTEGFLSFGEFALDVDEEVVTKADPAGGNYSIKILDANESLVVAKTYAEVMDNNDKISLPAGTYTLVASSLVGDVPMASWENPIYGTSKQFAIKAGEVTEIGSLTCTLVQCKVTVAYSDEFLSSITGEGKTTVEVTSGYPLDYALNANGTYDQSAGYFAVGNGSTMTVVFKGSVDGKTAKMTKTFTGVTARQWRQIKFVQKKNEQGQATFDIVIQDLISDAVLNNNMEAKEEILGDDPSAPKGDGGIDMAFDYESGCDQELTDLENMLIVPVQTRDMQIKLKATVPAGVLKFTVEVQSDNAGFSAALNEAGGSTIDLVNPSPASDIIFKVVPFPHGAELVGQTEILFDLSAAQDAIISFKGTHSFMMNIVDSNYCSKKIPVVMIVE